MNKLRKLTAFILVLSFFLSMGMPVLADDEAPEETGEDITSVESEEAPPETEAPIPEEDQPAEETEPPAPEETPVPEESTEPEETPAVTAEPAPEGDEPVDEPPEEESASEEPEEEEKEPRPWAEPGNTVVEILDGGRFLTVGDSLYYCDEGLWLDAGGGGSLLTSDNARNLNLKGNHVYYTVESDVRRIPLGGGEAETVYSFSSFIKQLYVMGEELRFVSGGAVYSYDMEAEELETLESPEDVLGLIPTPYGNLYLTGQLFHYTLWAETSSLLSDITQCYTDGDWLVVITGGETKQVSLAGLFEGQCSLQEYSLHQEMLATNGLSEEEQLANEAAFLQSDTYAQMQAAVEENENVSEIDISSGANSDATDGEFNMMLTASEPAAYSTTSFPDLNSNQKNIVKRARQMAEVLWTPIYWRYCWGGDDSGYVSSHSSSVSVTSIDGTVTKGYFAAGHTYQGVPYSQAVSTGYVGYTVNIDEFVSAVNNSSSAFYSGYSRYSRTAPYYGSDCSGFVSWAWNIGRRTCTGLLGVSTKIGKSISQLQVGDCLNDPNAHVVLVTDIARNSSGQIVSVEITEQTPYKMRVTCYGEKIAGKTYKHTGSLQTLQKYYLNGSYSIYRRNSSNGSVGFTEYSSVHLDGVGGRAPAPTVSVAVNSDGTAKVVTLKHEKSNAVIYYTTDGSAPTKSSPTYTGAFEVNKDTTVRAIADCGKDYEGYNELTYKVSAARAETPFIALLEGDMQDEFVSVGSKITVMNKAGDKIYYTTDGSTPTRNSTPAPAGGITISGDMTFKAIAVSNENLNSEVVTLEVKTGIFYEITSTFSSVGGYIAPGGQVGVLKGRDATFNIIPDKNYKIADVKVDGRSIGAKSSYTFTNVTAKHTISATFEVDLPFTDISGSWAASNIAFVYARNLFSGESNTIFSPENKMTRGMFITVLGRFAGSGQWTELEKWTGNLGFTNGSAINIRNTTTTADGVSAIIGRTGPTESRLRITRTVVSGRDGAMWYQIPYVSEYSDGGYGYIRAVDTTSSKNLVTAYTGQFTDLPSGQYFTGYAQWANIYDIMNGTSNTTFSPNQYIKRQDICVLMYRYLTEYLHRSVSASSAKFTDDANISNYAKTAVYAMKNIGVVNGYTNGSFLPHGYATRAEVAKMFESLYNYIYG